MRLRDATSFEWDESHYEGSSAWETTLLPYWRTRHKQEDHSGTPPANVLQRHCALMGGGCMQIAGTYLKTTGHRNPSPENWMCKHEVVETLPITLLG
ncbi:hypothetical protein DV515_00002851 [Chloebia gouldiae]|uniref:Uncharacterized protein n=1 Tax=Chloebia gouldiae TaxID=44316 RepID=A0A3L8SUY0_CHLGU|nr:hypothetical protein DV515_00002851 [Chloebia gouldiae]